MSKFSWRNGFAVGIVAGACVTTLVILFGQAIYDLAKCNHNGQCDRYAAQYESKNFPSSWWWLWDGQIVSASDTLAQWIMAVFTIAVALLVWRTLITTQQMVLETREIGQAQVRAHMYLEIVDVLVNAKLVGGDDHIKVCVKCKVHNTGNSPANRMSVLYEIDQTNLGDVVALNTGGTGLPLSQHSMASVAPNGHVFVGLENTFVADLNALSSGAAFVSLNYVIKCTDIFGIEVHEPLVAGYFKEHPANSGKYVFAHSRVVGKNPQS